MLLKVLRPLENRRGILRQFAAYSLRRLAFQHEVFIAHHTALQWVKEALLLRHVQLFQLPMVMYIMIAVVTWSFLLSSVRIVRFTT